MKKSLLCLLLGGMLCAPVVSANAAEESAQKALPSASANPFGAMDYDVTPLANYVKKYDPKAVNVEVDFLKTYFEWGKAVAGSAVQKAKEDILNILDPDGSKRAMFEGYVTKVLPLYGMAMMARVKPSLAQDVDKYSVDTVWAAPVDEIYYGLGSSKNYYDNSTALGLQDYEIEDGIASGGRPKHNQSYLWGLVTVGKKVYWCTNTNYLCVGGPSGGLGSAATTGDITQGYENDCWVCEFNSGQYGKDVHAKVKPEYKMYSDTRIPRIYCYDSETGVLEDITPYENTSATSTEGVTYKMLLDDCQGLRSAGAHNGVVFFGGPSLYGSTSGTTVGANFFALDSETGKFLDAKAMKDVQGHKITDIRRWLVHNGVLYCGVRLTDKNGQDCGAVLRWYGDKNNLWDFKVVGWLDNEAAELEVYNGKMYIGGWNTAALAQSTVVRGPEIPEDGLQPIAENDDDPMNCYAANNNSENPWKVIWRYDQYDKNVLGQRTTYTAGLKSWKGKLYWGMFAAAYTVPMQMKQFYPNNEMTDPEVLAFVLGSLRQTSFWRVDENDNVELLFGDPFVPYWHKFDKYEPVINPITKEPILDASGKPTMRPAGEDKWDWHMNGFMPKWGRAGYGQLFTAYSWTLEEYHGDLYVGTMNMENLVGGVAGSETSGMSNLAGPLQLLLGVKPENYGFELVRFQDPEQYPSYITTNGFGNGTAYGIRNFTKCGDDLYIGSASPLNLMPNGGCHLFKLNDGQNSEQTEEILPTGISQAKAPGVMFKRHDNCITVGTLGGEDIDDVTVYDAGGRTLYNTKGGRIAAIPTEALSSNVVIIKVKSAKGEWTKEIVK